MNKQEKINWVRSLHPGDEVVWSRLDGGSFSKVLVLKIQNIKFLSDEIVEIEDEFEGTIYKCYVRELSPND